MAEVKLLPIGTEKTNEKPTIDEKALENILKDHFG